MSDLTFEPPGPGTWSFESLHFPAPLSRYFSDIYPATMEAGTNRGLAEYGMPMNIEVETVNGYWYSARRPILPDPPYVQERPESRAELQAEYQRRVDRMAKTFKTKRWRDDIDRWDAELKPTHRERLHSLQTVDPDELDDGDLLKHVENCRDAFRDGGDLHHRMSITTILPVGDFLAQAREWTDRPREELIELLDGASPKSTGADEELQRVVDALEANGDARRTLFSGAPPGEILDTLRGDDAVGTAMEAWLSVAGYRIATGYSLADKYALEQPEMVVRTLRTAVEQGGSGAVDHDSEARYEAIRSAVSTAHRPAFDELFTEARRVHRIRDEREIDLWSQGLLRRALLAVGRRLAARGQLHEPNHVIDLHHRELVAAFRHGDGPSAAEVAARVEYRTSHGSDDAPDQLGPDPVEPFDGFDLAEPIARALRAFEALRDDELTEPTEQTEDDVVIRGHGASQGRHEGRGRIVAGPDDFAAIDEGDVLIAELTSSAFNVVLPLLGGLVTDEGGMLSHPAIVAREYGIPAVVGCDDATDRIRDGDRVVVDGDDGTIRLVERNS